ncbi:hypothetical protein LZ30DRAFT_695313 [Colletotrichum cereale]|nr:hypothetical protein LZ30DRAFT_695313 [Colletotrichum cereale]
MFAHAELHSLTHGFRALGHSDSGPSTPPICASCHTKLNCLTLCTASSTSNYNQTSDSLDPLQDALHLPSLAAQITYPSSCVSTLFSLPLTPGRLVLLQPLCSVSLLHDSTLWAELVGPEAGPM